jgi:two-component system, NtrC family, response regulator HydG
MKTPDKQACLRILLVDDEEQILFSSALLLKGSGLGTALTLSDGSRLLALLEKEDVALIVLDLNMPGVSGQDLLKEISYRFPQILVIVMTAVNEVTTAVECMKSGAFDYLTKPVQKDVFLACVRRALEVCSLKRENLSLRESIFSGALRHEDVFGEIVTANRQMRSAFQYMEAVAGLDEPLLITGESGVGKELIARAVHRLSGRKGELVTVNAAGLDDGMFSDTIFGHGKGAFTGAEKEREGLIARAAGGTLFLDEIGDLEAKSQVKLLRLFQEREYYPLGTDAPKKTDCRILVATNRDLRQMVEEGKFRNDLYFRLCSHNVEVPPLRERNDDLPLLVGHFLEQAALAQGKTRPAFPKELITLLATYPFPGNIRELKGMVDDAVTRHKRGVLSLESFQRRIEKGGAKGALVPRTHGNPPFPPFADRLPTFHEAEAYLVEEALKLAQGNQGMAARMLGVTRQALNRRLHKPSLNKG